MDARTAYLNLDQSSIYSTREGVEVATLDGTIVVLSGSAASFGTLHKVASEWQEGQR